MTPPCTNCGKPARVTVSDVPGGAVLWACAALWSSIYGAESWAANLLVWRVEFVPPV